MTTHTTHRRLAALLGYVLALTACGEGLTVVNDDPKHDRDAASDDLMVTRAVWP